MLRPRRGRPNTSFPERIFRDIEIAKTGRERTDNAPASFSRHLVQDSQTHCRAYAPPSSGRISIEPSCNKGSFFAMAMAASKSGTSIR